MQTKVLSPIATPAPLVADMATRWRPTAAPQEEGIRLVAEALHHAGLELDEVKELVVNARPAAEQQFWQDIFVHHRQQVCSPRKSLPAPRLEGPDLQRSCARIASHASIRVLQGAHEAFRDEFRERFGLSSIEPSRQHVVSFAGPIQGQILAKYLGVAQERLLALKTSNSVRCGGAHGSALKQSSSVLRAMRKKVADYPARSALPGGSITVLGHFRWDEQDRPQCGFLRANELVDLFGDAFEPRVLNLFFCGSEPFARECAALLQHHEVTINYVVEGEEVNLFEPPEERAVRNAKARSRWSNEGAPTTPFYYGGPNVAVDGDMGKVFGPRQRDAYGLFQTLEVRGRASP